MQRMKCHHREMKSSSARCRSPSTRLTKLRAALLTMMPLLMLVLFPTSFEATIVPARGRAIGDPLDGAIVSPRSSTTAEKYRGTRGRGGRGRRRKGEESSLSQRRRRDQDVEHLLNDMATRDPSEWSAIEWFVMILFLSFLGWTGCCLFALCCCGGCCRRRGGGCTMSDLLGYLCLWEVCCRGGRDVDECCNYGLA